VNDYRLDSDKAVSDLALYDINNDGKTAKFYRHRSNGYYDADKDISSNIEGRFFYTPAVKKGSYTVSIGQRYIYIS
jgi:hypothetical protein